MGASIGAWRMAAGCLADPEAALVRLAEDYVMQSYAIGETSADPGGIPYRWAVKGLIPLGFALLFVQTLGALAKLVIVEQQRRGGTAEAAHV